MDQKVLHTELHPEKYSLWKWKEFRRKLLTLDNSIYIQENMKKTQVRKQKMMKLEYKETTI
jgi:hypothetical protein